MRKEHFFNIRQITVQKFQDCRLLQDMRREDDTKTVCNLKSNS